MSDEERARIAELLRDDGLSYREIARRTGFSDFTIRAVARKLTGDDRPMKRSRHEREDESDGPLGFIGWATLAGIGGLFIGAVWLLGRWMPPPDA